MDCKVLLFKDNKYIEAQARDNLMLNANARLALSGDVVMLNDAVWAPYDYAELPGGGKAVLLPCIGQLFSIINQPTVKIGRQETDHVCIQHSAVSAAISNGTLLVQAGTVYLNGAQIVSGCYSLDEGDVLFFDGTEILYNTDYISCIGRSFKCRLNAYYSKRQLPEDFPKYTRSPRIIKREPTANVELQIPKDREKAKKGGLVKLILPPLAMAALTAGMGFMMGRGIFMLVTAGGTLLTSVFSITSFFEDRKDLKQAESDRQESYKKYLLKQRKALNNLKQRFIASRAYHNPTVREIESMIACYSSRIYERRYNDGDFLQFSIGLSDCEPTYGIHCNIDELDAKKDPAYLEMQSVYREFRELEDVPAIIDLKNAHLGIVGDSEYIHTQLKAIITQLTFMQSYHDIEIITLVDEESRPEFEWIRWYPHCKLNMINVSALISGESQRDQVLGSIAQVLKQRKQYIEEAKKDTLFTPHYVFIIDNPNLIISHSLMEHLQEEKSVLGFSLIYTTHLLSNLPDNIKTVMTIETREKGTLLLNEGELVNKPLKLHNIDGVDLEAMSRGLAPLNHNKGISTQIPETVTFFELYGVKHPTELPLNTLWAQNAPHKSLAVPLGLRAKDDIVSLNLHENSHGPHGLVAGTTGSGKSEILQSYILSLAVNFHPYDVGFLLIDYKGGGMANLFKDLPHLLGTITNLDGSESFRALASIKSELARRQRIFKDNEVNAINQYTKLFKEGRAKEPLPHLFIISDEFAELKKEQPDFMQELVSAARIGRSLGVHLILATQKPSGVVDDQIWSNSRFKLALKVQDESDSKEVIKTPDAARITQPGRAYLQVGNNEIYELFQSAWSGADYSTEREKQEFDSRVYLVNELGQGVLLNEDLSAVSTGSSSSGVSQLDATVETIRKIYDAAQSAPVARPWLPPLETQIITPHICVDSIRDVGAIDTLDSTVKIGLADIPEQQTQLEYEHSFIADGNLAVFGASGFGKSTAEMQIALSLAVKNSPRLLKYYVLDFGNASLIQLRDLPHTADYLSLDDAEKRTKLLKLLQEEITARKQLFAKENAVNFTMYNTVAASKLPVIIVFIDNYDVVKEMGHDIEDEFIKITRDGVGLGIFTVIAATRINSVHYAIMNNFKNKICNFMFDQSDISSLIGRSSYILPEVRGRAMIKRKDICIMQEYLPVRFDNEVDYINNLRAVVFNINEQCSAEKNRGIPILPDILLLQDLMQAKPDNKKPGIAVGLDTENVMPQFLDKMAQKLLIVGTSLTGKTNILKLILSQLGDAQVFIADAKSMDLQGCASRPNTEYMASASEAREFMDKLGAMVKQRRQQFSEQGGDMRPRDFYAALPRVACVIDDAGNFMECCSQHMRDLERLMPEILEVGAYIYASTQPDKLRAFDEVAKLLLDTTHGIILGNPDDQREFTVPYIRNYKAIIDMGYIHRMGQNVLIKIPSADV
jgi:S-DNA-T family DNA segregation ATPase FtsK/SpoIIIE